MTVFWIWFTCWEEDKKSGLCPGFNQGTRCRLHERSKTCCSHLTENSTVEHLEELSICSAVRHSPIHPCSSKARNPGTLYQQVPKFCSLAFIYCFQIDSQNITIITILSTHTLSSVFKALHMCDLPYNSPVRQVLLSPYSRCVADRKSSLSKAS